MQLIDKYNFSIFKCKFCYEDSDLNQKYFQSTFRYVKQSKRKCNLLKRLEHFDFELLFFQIPKEVLKPC